MWTLPRGGEHIKQNGGGENHDPESVDYWLPAWVLRVEQRGGIASFSPSSDQIRLRVNSLKGGCRLTKHAPYYWLLLAESRLTRRLFGSMVGRIAALSVPTG
jgi:hypothetical protein